MQLLALPGQEVLVSSVKAAGKDHQDSWGGRQWLEKSGRKGCAFCYNRKWVWWIGIFWGCTRAFCTRRLSSISLSSIKFLRKLQELSKEKWDMLYMTQLLQVFSRALKRTRQLAGKTASTNFDEARFSRNKRDKGWRVKRCLSISNRMTPWNKPLKFLMTDRFSKRQLVLQRTFT